MEWYARHLNCRGRLACISGSTPQGTKTQLLQAFREGRISVLAFSRAGDTSIDIPTLQVVIQVAGHGACRRQEVQRAGRCTRLARGKTRAAFYTLTTCGAREDQDTARRQSYLKAEGYTYAMQHEPAAPGGGSGGGPAAALARPPPAAKVAAAAPRAKKKRTLRDRLRRGGGKLR